MSRSTLLVLCSSLVLAACSGNPPGPDSGLGNGNDAGGSDAGSISLSQAETDLATAECNKFNICGQFILEILFGDMPTCVARAKASIAAENGISGVTFTASQGEACAQAYASESCSDFRNGVQPTACNISGSLAAGTACGTNVQCQSSYCKGGSGSTCGVCAATVAPGAACTTNGDCGPGNDCANSVCVVPAALGAPCSNSQPCLGSLNCDPTTNVCAALITTPGTSCSKTANNCDFWSGLYCSASSVCAVIPTAAPGSACGFIGGSVTFCSGGGTCLIVGTTGSGTCAAPIADGQSCGTDAGLPTCQTPSSCVTGTCTLPNPGGCH
jgi:hypothetical protein